MTEIDERYKRGKIYTIRCRYDDCLVYVGSTIDKLSKRIAGHRKDKKCSLYKIVDGDWDNWYIELYEDFPCDNKDQLIKREGELIREIATINKCIAGRDMKQYYKDNRDKIAENQKQYRQDNRDKIAEQMKQYRQDNRDKLAELEKQYRQDNSDRIRKRDKEKYYKNRDEILDKMKQKCKCDICGAEVVKYGIRRHQRTAKCMNAKKE